MSGGDAVLTREEIMARYRAASPTGSTINQTDWKR
jgi:hypothetical protein